MKVPVRIEQGKLNFDRPFTHTIFVGVESVENVLYVHFDLKPEGQNPPEHMPCFLQIQHGREDLEVHSRGKNKGEDGTLMGKLYLR